MSPTSYQAAPPREFTIAERQAAVKFPMRLRSSFLADEDEHRGTPLRTVGPGDDLLCGGLASGTTGEPHKGRAGSNCAGNIDGPRRRECCVGHRVRDGHRECGAVVGDVHLEEVATVQVYSPAQSDGRTSGGRTVDVQPRGVIPFTRVLEQIELYGDALGNPARAARQASAIPEAAAGRTEGCSS